MTACPALLAGGPLACTLDAGHAHGHAFAASWAPDVVRDEEAAR